MNIFQFKKFKSNRNIKHAISTKDFGSMKNEDGSVNRNNLNKFLKASNLPHNPVCMGQVHGGDVAVVENSNQFIVNNTDGLITNKKDVPLCVLTADCLPIILFDPKKQIAGIVHAGLKGLQNGIIKNMIKKFKDSFKSDPSDIIVGIGPGIEKKCYEVDGSLVDIKKIAIDSLQNLGIKPANIESIDTCTKCNDKDFYSYRNGDIYPRFATVVSLV